MHEIHRGIDELHHLARPPAPPPVPVLTEPVAKAISQMVQLGPAAHLLGALANGGGSLTDEQCYEWAQLVNSERALVSQLASGLDWDWLLNRFERHASAFFEDVEWEALLVQAATDADIAWFDLHAPWDRFEVVFYDLSDEDSKKALRLATRALRTSFSVLAAMGDRTPYLLEYFKPTLAELVPVVHESASAQWDWVIDLCQHASNTEGLVGYSDGSQAVGEAMHDLEPPASPEERARLLERLLFDLPREFLDNHLDGLTESLEESLALPKLRDIIELEDRGALHGYLKQHLRSRQPDVAD